MHKFLIPAFLIFVSALAVAQQAAPEPYHIKQDVLGETLDEYKANHADEKGDCVFATGSLGLHDRSEGVQVCVTLARKQTMTYASVAIDGRMEEFVGGRLESLTMSFKEGDYDSLKAALTDKFGKPSKVSSKAVQNRMGAQFINESSLWINGIATIGLDHYGRDLDHATLIFGLDALADDAHRKMDPSKVRKDM